MLKEHLTFDGELYVHNNDWDFYLGDTIWAPINKIIAGKTFNVYNHNENQFWKRRGC